MAHSLSQVWTTPGSYNFTVPTSVKVLRANILAGGGGGDRDLAGNNAGGRGGGSAELVSGVWIYAAPGDIIPVVVGAGGAKGFWNSHTIPTNGAVAGVGGNSSFGIYVALGGGRFETVAIPQNVASFGGGVNGGLQTNVTTQIFADTIGLADGTLWYGGAGGGAYVDPASHPGGNATAGGPSGGRAQGGAGGINSGGSPFPGPGGGGAASLWGPGAVGSVRDLDGVAAVNYGTGGGGAGGTQSPPGTGPFHDGGDGYPGRVEVFWWI